MAHLFPRLTLIGDQPATVRRPTSECRPGARCSSRATPENKDTVPRRAGVLVFRRRGNRAASGCPRFQEAGEPSRLGSSSFSGGGGTEPPRVVLVFRRRGNRAPSGLPCFQEGPGLQEFVLVLRRQGPLAFSRQEDQTSPRSSLSSGVWRDSHVTGKQVRSRTWALLHRSCTPQNPAGIVRTRSRRASPRSSSAGEIRTGDGRPRGDREKIRSAANGAR